MFSKSPFFKALGKKILENCLPSLLVGISAVEDTCNNNNNNNTLLEELTTGILCIFTLNYFFCFYS